MSFWFSTLDFCDHLVLLLYLLADKSQSASADRLSNVAGHCECLTPTVHLSLLTISHPPSTFHRPPYYPLSTIHRLPSTICHSMPTIHRLPSTVYHPSSTTRYLPCAVYHPLCTIHRLSSSTHHDVKLTEKQISAPEKYRLVVEKAIFG